jgi:hypothetical protein
MASEVNPMRMVSAAIVLPWLIGCAAQPRAPYAEVELPYSACEPMAELRSNLTGAPDPSAKSDALPHRLGVRCVGYAYPTRVHARY